MSASEDNVKGVNEWFKLFPEFKTNPLWLSGESYAGIYVPYLAWQIDQQNAQAAEAEKINLKGIMVGNGVTNWTYDTLPATIEVMYGRSFMSQELYFKMKADKCDYSGVNFDRFPSASCMDYLDEMGNAIANIDIYNIYGYCYPTDSYDLENVGRKKFPFLTQVSEMPPCSWGTPLEDYFNREDVRTALHVPEYVQNFSFCGDINYTMNETGSQWIWEELKGKYQMLKFSGDKDGSVPGVGTMGWINALDWAVTEEWRSFKIGDQIGGYVEVRDGLTFISAHGAGHMVPQDQRALAAQFINRFIHGQP